MTQSYLGDNLYALRKQKGISQDEFAESLGVSRQAVSKWERNEAYPDTENLIAISRFFGVSIDDIINTPISAQSTEVQIEINPLQNDDSTDSDDEDDDNNDEDTEDIFHPMYVIPYSGLITIAYLLWGFLGNRGWQIGWTLYVTVPVFYSIIDCIKTKRLVKFEYAAFVTFIFLLFGMICNIWHPLWLVFLTIPIYYPIASAIDKTRNKNKE